MSGDYELDTTLMLKVLSRLYPQMKWTSEWLHANVRDRADKKMKTGVYTIEYKGQPEGRGTKHRWRIYTDNEIEKIKLDDAVKSKQGVITHFSTPSQQGSSFNNTDTFFWNGLQLRSMAEQKIAEELERRKILFFANSRCRITNRIQITETKEVDFLVYYNGNSRILEVDGQEYHQSASEDHKRDRLFERQGIKCNRFTANECLDDPQTVIDEFLELFDTTHIHTKDSIMMYNETYETKNHNQQQRQISAKSTTSIKGV